MNHLKHKLLIASSNIHNKSNHNNSNNPNHNIMTMLVIFIALIIGAIVIFKLENTSQNTNPKDILSCANISPSTTGLITCQADAVLGPQSLNFNNLYQAHVVANNVEIPVTSKQRLPNTKLNLTGTFNNNILNIQSFEDNTLQTNEESICLKDQVYKEVYWSSNIRYYLNDINIYPKGYKGDILITVQGQDIINITPSICHS